MDSSLFADKDAYERLKCPHCKRLLNDPVQPSCGHRLCRVCANELIDSGPSPPRCPLEDCQEEFELEDGEPVRILKAFLSIKINTTLANVYIDVHKGYAIANKQIKQTLWL